MTIGSGEGQLRYSWWRDMVFTWGVGAMLLCGLIIGKEYFNHSMQDMLESKDTK